MIWHPADRDYKTNRYDSQLRLTRFQDSCPIIQMITQALKCTQSAPVQCDALLFMLVRSHLLTHSLLTGELDPLSPSYDNTV